MTTRKKNGSVVIPRWAAELLAASYPRTCAVCAGISPPWDGHDVNPPCVGYAREKVREALDA